MNIYHEIMFIKKSTIMQLILNGETSFFIGEFTYDDWSSLFLSLRNNRIILKKLRIVSQMLRQSGHIFIEGNVSGNEVVKIGFNTNMKITTITLMLLIKALDCYFNDSFENFIDFKYMFYFYLSSFITE